MGVYLLVSHEQQKSKQSESWTYVKLPSEQKNIRGILSDTYRSMPDPMQLAMLLSIYDELPDSSIADLLACKQEVVSRLLQEAYRLFIKAVGQAVSRKCIYEMLKKEIEEQPLAAELVERVKKNLCKTLFDSS